MPPTNPRNFRLHSSRSPYFSTARRRFLQASVAAASGAILSNCARNLSSSNVPSASPSASSSSSPSASSNKTLYVYTWANYTDEELLKNFRDKTGIKVIVDTYDSNETMLAKMQAGGGSAYSIVYPSDYMVTQMVKSGMLTPLDKSRLSGLDSLRAKWKSPIYDPDNAHSIPATWGTTGLIYNPAKVNGSIEGWDYIWSNIGSLTRRVTLLSDVREVMGATLRYLGYSFNSTKPDEIKAAYDKLVELKPAIASFVTNGWEDQLAGGDLFISMAYSQDAIALMEEKPGLKYSVPKTGTSLWTDTMVIPKTAPNLDAAYEWLNFMLEPNNSAKLVERLRFATPNDAAFKLLPSTLQNNKELFPSKEVLDNSEGIAPVDQKIADLYDSYWTKLTSA